MRIAKSLSAVAIAAGLLAGGAFVVPSFAQERRATDVGEQRWLSIPQVYQKLEAAGYSRIEKIERERGSYEVRATDRDGRRIRLDVNPQSGDILDARAAESRHAAKVVPAGARADGQRNAAECNERRCRDDLPASRAVTTPTTR